MCPTLRFMEFHNINIDKARKNFFQHLPLMKPFESRGLEIIYGHHELGTVRLFRGGEEMYIEGEENVLPDWDVIFSRVLGSRSRDLYDEDHYGGDPYYGFDSEGDFVDDDFYGCDCGCDCEECWGYVEEDKYNTGFNRALKILGSLATEVERGRLNQNRRWYVY